MKYPLVQGEITHISFIHVSVGRLSGGDAVKDVPIPKSRRWTQRNQRNHEQTSTLMLFMKAHESFSAATEVSKVWLGEVLGSISKRVHECMGVSAHVRPFITGLQRGADTEKLHLVCYQDSRCHNHKKNSEQLGAMLLSVYGRNV